MRASVALFALVIAVPALAASGSRSIDVQTVPQAAPGVGARSTANCPHARSYVAQDRGVYQGQKLAPRKLTELPPAVGYMAVLREIGGCDAPLTVVEYRNTRRR
jgi:hypothetical protein